MPGYPGLSTEIPVAVARVTDRDLLERAVRLLREADHKADVDAVEALVRFVGSGAYSSGGRALVVVVLLGSRRWRCVRVFRLGRLLACWPARRPEHTPNPSGLECDWEEKNEAQYDQPQCSHRT